ncbi:hypothetical protein [uncultured Mailhella sp.]|uniref:hypothetical protein n=1 Tax=uncultured Mailhella sp. TaxID=1981031 RepID=UPI00320BB063
MRGVSAMGMLLKGRSENGGLKKKEELGGRRVFPRISQGEVPYKPFSCKMDEKRRPEAVRRRAAFGRRGGRIVEKEIVRHAAAQAMGKTRESVRIA